MTQYCRTTLILTSLSHNFTGIRFSSTAHQSDNQPPTARNARPMNAFRPGNPTPSLSINLISNSAAPPPWIHALFGLLRNSKRRFFSTESSVTSSQSRAFSQPNTAVQSVVGASRWIQTHPTIPSSFAKIRFGLRDLTTGAPEAVLG
jgi:hypothetical protein